MKTFCLALSMAAATAIEIGERIPSGISLHEGFPPKQVNLAEYVAGRKVILMGLPGAFTPT